MGGWPVGYLHNAVEELNWRFSLKIAPIHWLVHGHMTPNNETVYRQMPWASNVAKTMTSKGKQFTVTREMLAAVAGDQRWPDIVPGISADWDSLTGPLGSSEFCLPRISMFLGTKSRETLRFEGNKIHCSPIDQSLSDYSINDKKRMHILAKRRSWGELLLRSVEMWQTGIKCNIKSEHC